MKLSFLAIIVVASSLAFTNLITMPASADAVRHEYYMIVAQGKVGQFSNLEAPCGSTGLLLVVYHVPPGIEVTQTGTIAGTRTCSCCPPPPGCCDQTFVVYSIRSNTPGQYEVEFRVGRGDASAEYYEVDVLHVTVTSSVPSTNPSGLSNIEWFGSYAIQMLALVIVIAVSASVLFIFSRARKRMRTVTALPY
jgi:hypothetical protein